jgi:hypothetical protein
MNEETGGSIVLKVREKRKLQKKRRVLSVKVMVMDQEMG